MKPNVLVINPCVADFKLYDEWMHPTGLYFLIDLLERNSITTFYFDFLSPLNHVQEKKFGTGTFPNREIQKPAIYAEIKRKYKLYGSPASVLKTYLEQIPTPDLICIGSLMTYWALGVIETITIIRTYLPDTPIVCGGIATQLIPDFFKSRAPDCFIATNLFTAIQPNSGIPILSGIKLDMNLASMSGGIRKISHSPHGPLLLSLGCPMRCTYCASSVLQPQYQIRKTESVIQEMELFINTFGTIDFAFYDDALLYNKDNVLYPFLKRVKEIGTKVRLHTPNGLHVRFVDQKSLNAMKEAGFTTIRYGYESGHLQYRKATSGKINHEELSQKVSLTIESGFLGKQIGIYVMGGLPSQTPEDMIEDLDFINSLGVSVKPVFISPVPGSMLFNEYAQQFPQLKTDPLWHNDTFFITNLKHWDESAINTIRQRARQLNNNLVNN